MDDRAASQREVDLLRQDVRELSKRMDDLDTHGTRGVVILQTQVVELIRDLTELKADFGREVKVLKDDVNTRFSEHLRQHKEEIQARQSSRRWLVGIGIAAIGSMVAVITLLLEILGKIHGS